MIESTLKTPIGTVRLWGDDKSVFALDLPIHKHSFVELFPHAKKQKSFWATEKLEAYFDGEIDAIDDIAIAPAGPAFYQKCWRQLRRVRGGETITYAGLAKKVGSNAIRAVGSANARNPIALIVPCHRVIRTGGDIGNYGGGVPAKRWLLDHELRHAR